MWQLRGKTIENVVSHTTYRSEILIYCTDGSIYYVESFVISYDGDSEITCDLVDEEKAKNIQDNW